MIKNAAEMKKLQSGETRDISTRGLYFLIEQDLHLRDFQGPSCVLQNAPSLLSRDAWKPLQKVLYGSAVFDVFEQRSDWHTSTTE